MGHGVDNSVPLCYNQDMDMNFQKASASQLIMWANFHNNSIMVMIGLLEFVDIQSANQIQSGAIRGNITAFRNFLAMVDILERSIIEQDGHLNKVWEYVKQQPYMRKLWDELTEKEFTEALALALHNCKALSICDGCGKVVEVPIGIPVREEYIGAPVAENLEEQWGGDNVYRKRVDE